MTPPTRMISVEAGPEPLTMDLARGLLFIDMQNDFGARGGIFDRAGVDYCMIQKQSAQKSLIG